MTTTAGFIRVADHAVDRIAEIGRLAFGVYCVLLRHANRARADKCFPSEDTIAKYCGVTARSVRTALRTLEAAGLITTEAQMAEGRQTSNLYRFTGVPPDNTRKPASGRPEDSFRGRRKPASAKPDPVEPNVSDQSDAPDSKCQPRGEPARPVDRADRRNAESRYRILVDDLLRRLGRPEDDRFVRRVAWAVANGVLSESLAVDAAQSVREAPTKPAKPVAYFRTVLTRGIGKARGIDGKKAIAELLYKPGPLPKANKVNGTPIHRVTLNQPDAEQDEDSVRLRNQTYLESIQ